jgi:hypothetical protein
MKKMSISKKVRNDEGLPVVKLMMLLSSLAPLFILIGIRGMDKLINYNLLWIIIGLILIIPFTILLLRIQAAKKSDDKFNVNVQQSKLNKEYLFTYLFTVLLPLYSVTVTSEKELIAIFFAILFVIFVLWNLNLHFINIFFAAKGYKVYTLPNQDSAILLSIRNNIPEDIISITAHRLSNSVFIELKNYDYGN